MGSEGHDLARLSWSCWTSIIIQIRKRSQDLLVISNLDHSDLKHHPWSGPSWLLNERTLRRVHQHHSLQCHHGFRLENLIWKKKNLWLWKRLRCCHHFLNLRSRFCPSVAIMLNFDYCGNQKKITIVQITIQNIFWCCPIDMIVLNSEHWGNRKKIMIIQITNQMIFWWSQILIILIRTTPMIWPIPTAARTPNTVHTDDTSIFNAKYVRLRDDYNNAKNSIVTRV